MIRKYKNRITAVLCSFALMAPIFVTNAAAAQTDDFILKDPTRGVYIGRDVGAAIIHNISFTDVPVSHWARQPIMQASALDYLKPYDRVFSPTSQLTNKDAIASILRAAGYETDAVTAANTLAAVYKDSTAEEVWGLAYLQIAQSINMIAAEDYSASLPAAEDTTSVNGFDKNAPVTRENMAFWVYTALNFKTANTFKAEPTQNIIRFNDWRSISANRAQAVDAIVKAGIITADENKNFNPKSPMSKAQAAQMFINLEPKLFPIVGLEKRVGTVSKIVDAQKDTTGKAAVSRTIYVRSADGKVDALLARYKATEISYGPNVATLDAAIYRDRGVRGLSSLDEGDEIEYIITSDSPGTGTGGSGGGGSSSRQTEKNVYYVNVVKPLTKRTLEGTLLSVSSNDSSITLKSADGKTFTYVLAEGLIAADTSPGSSAAAPKPSSGTGAASSAPANLYQENLNKTIMMSGKRYKINELPVGAIIELKLKNDVVTEIVYKGMPALVREVRGIVIENDAGAGYITIIDNDRNEQTFTYLAGGMIVRKTQYYDNNDLGFLARMFPNFKFDQLATTMDDIDPGDVVYLTLDPDDPTLITGVQVSVNYRMKYGKVLHRANDGVTLDITVQYENNQTAAFNVGLSDILITKDGRISNADAIELGDYVKLLVNEAVLQPGQTTETVKEIAVESSGHFIEGLYKGELTSLNAIQMTMNLEATQTLSKTGWVDYKDIMSFNVKNRDIEFYSDGTRISQDRAVKFFKNGGATAYIATEAAYGGERVVRVTFRTGRDEVLDDDDVLSSSGAGSFNILGYPSAISTDDGTIVVRYGRLVNSSDIFASDHVRVVLNGGPRAAIVDISDTPGTSQVMFLRGRIDKAPGTKSFRTESSLRLGPSTPDWEWLPNTLLFFPTEHAIDGKTIFINASGVGNSSMFIDSTTGAIIDPSKAYTIVTDGSRAAFVVDAPAPTPTGYPNKAMHGVVHRVDVGGIHLKNVRYWNGGTWVTLPTALVKVAPYTITAKNNKIVTADELVEGDSVVVMTVTPGGTCDGYIVIVDN